MKKIEKTFTGCVYLVQKVNIGVTKVSAKIIGLSFHYKIRSHTTTDCPREQHELSQVPINYNTTRCLIWDRPILKSYYMAK